MIQIQSCSLMRAPIVLLMLLLAGCSGPASESPEPEPVQAKDPEPAAEGNKTVQRVPAEDPMQPVPTWGDLETAILRPGDQVITSLGQCTTGFFFQNETDLFVSTAAHCFGAGVTPGSDAEDFCHIEDAHKLGESAQVEGLSKPLTLVYSAWPLMEGNETDESTCSGNDFAVLRIDPDDWHRANPTMRAFGGPTELREANTMPHGSKILYYGRTSLLPDQDALRRHEGYVVLTDQQSSQGWMIDAVSVPPGIPGDSGSAVTAADGAALGLMVYISALGTNGITNMAWALDYMEAQAGWRPELATAELLDPGHLPDP